MVQAIPAVAAWAAGSAVAAAVVATINTILINIALGALARALAKEPNRQAPAINVSVRNPIENRKLVWGTARVGGSFVFFDAVGPTNKILWYLIAVAGHQVHAIRDVWLDTVRVTNAQIAGGAAGGGAVAAGAFADKLEVWKHLGTSEQNVDPKVNYDFLLWNDSHRLQGIAYIAVRMEKDEKKYPNGAPSSVSALVDGALLYDPRKDSTNGGSGTHRRTNPSTWEFSENPILAWRWFVSGGSVHNDKTSRLVRYGLRELDSRIPDDYVAAAANVCDETLSGAVAPPSGSQKRYRIGLEVSTGETRREIIEHILATCDGSHAYVHGKHRVYAGAYREPSHFFSSKDLYGALEVEDTWDQQRRYNQVAPVFRDSANEYIEQTGGFRTDSNYEAQDNNEPIPTEIDLRGVTSSEQAQRLAEIKLRKGRMMRSVKLPGALNLLRVAQLDTLAYTHARYGWSNRVFCCLDRELVLTEGAGKVVLTCDRADAGVYNDMLTADYKTGTSDTDTFRNEIPDPPTNLRAEGLRNGILWQWNLPAVVVPGTLYESRFSTAQAMTSPTTDYLGPDLQLTQPRTSTSNIYRQVRAVLRGQPSEWHPETSGVMGRASEIQLALSGAVNPGAASSKSGAASQTTNSVTVTASFGTPGYTFAWTWLSGGSGITINSPSAATTSFTATTLTSGQVRSGVARCTITDSAGSPATFTIDVPVNIERPAPTVSVPSISLYSVKISPANSSVAFQLDSDGHVYVSLTTALPTTDRGFWVNPVEYAADYQVRVTRTAGEAAFTSGLLNTWQALSTDRAWRLTNTTDGFSQIFIEFTVEIRRASDLVVVAVRTGCRLQADVEP